MQYLEIDKDGEMFARVQLGDDDLMEIKSDDWEDDIKKRGLLLDMMLIKCSREPLINQIRSKLKPKFYLVIESRMNKETIFEPTH